jgi:hypothetical protein
MPQKILLLVGICCGLLLPAFSSLVQAQEISPVQEQEHAEAKAALQAAEKADAEKYAPEPLRQCEDLLATAEKARSAKDVVRFTQASRLARAHAELAKAIAELRAEEEKLTAANEELQKIKAEIERLKRAQ